MRVFELLEDEKNYFIVSELMEGGELYDRIIEMKRFSERDAANIIYQVLLGVAYMHGKKVCHRDLKPENILLDSQDRTRLNIKITDFGFAKFHDPHSEEGMSDMLGSPLYMAPEIIKKLPYDYKVDIWSMGVILYIMMTGRPPFKGRTKEEIFISVAS